MNWGILTNTSPLQHIPQKFRKITTCMFKGGRYWKNSDRRPTQRKKEEKSKKKAFIIYQSKSQFLFLLPNISERFLHSETSHFLWTVTQKSSSFAEKQFWYSTFVFQNKRMLKTVDRRCRKINSIRNIERTILFRIRFSFHFWI